MVLLCKLLNVGLGSIQFCRTQTVILHAPGTFQSGITLVMVSGEGGSLELKSGLYS